MALSLGTTTLAALYLGSTAISAAYLGSVQVYDPVGAFTPASLFASGEQGAWYEPSTTTAFTATATSTNGFTDIAPAGYGDRCAILLDKSQGAGYSGGSFTGLGSELVTNGTFDSDVSGWTTNAPSTATVSSGQVSLARNSGGVVDQLAQTGILTSGKTYLVSVDVIALSHGLVVDLSDGLDLDYTYADPSPGTGTIEFVAVARGSNLYVAAGYNLNATATLDNISVRELPGNHATQGTESARPILARVPETERRNLLERTEEFDNAYWTKLRSSFSGSTLTSAATDTRGSGLNTTITGASSTNTDYVYALRLEYTDNPWVSLGIVMGGEIARAWFNLQTGVKGTTVVVGTATVVDYTITAVGDGSYDCVLIANSGSGGAGDLSPIGPYFASADGDFNSTSGNTILVYRAQLEEGSSATAYQKVVDQYDVTEAGVTSLEYLAFDGSDDFMLHTVNVETAIAAAVSVSSSQTWYRGIFASGSVGSGSMLLSRGATSPYGTFGATYHPSGTVLTSSPNVVVMEGLSSGTFYTDGVSDGTYSATSGQPTKHIGGESAQRSSINLFSLIALDRAFGSDRINTEAYLAAKSGVVL